MSPVRRRNSKRAFDVVWATMLLVVMSPFVIVFLIAIKSEQILRGRPFDPFFYREIRMSQGQPFQLLKFNIFKYERILAERAQGGVIHTKGYERNGGILKTGWCLKQIYMDELPQLFNILKGDMSMVGPRPLNPEALQISLDQGNTAKILLPAGLTGHQQSQKQLRGMGVQLDAEYVKVYSEGSWYQLLLFDIRILLRTIRFVLKAQGQ